MISFHDFKVAVTAQFEVMAKELLLVSNVSKDSRYEAYLAAFPEGSNPLHITNTVHDCNCCKSFIRRVGNVVAYVDGKLVSIWDIDIGGDYQVVADALSKLSIESGVQGIFLTEEDTAGTDISYSDRENGVLTFEHFHVDIPQQFVVSDGTLAEKRGTINTNYKVFKRSLTEMTIESCDLVLELIDMDNGIYRGAEHRATVEFIKARLSGYARSINKDLYLWENVITIRDPALRNTVIGTLICDLDEGVSVEAAVAKFESKMDGYKRTTAIASPKQIADANARVIELGLNDSLARRFAESDDLTINNVLFADVSVQESMGVLADALTAFSVAKPKLSGEPLKMSVEEFLRDVLPVSTGIEVNFSNEHQNKLMSVIAPVNKEAPGLFKWDNNFSWTYNGELADSMRERVKAAGGKIDGQLRASLEWDYKDDLDIHVDQPQADRIYHGVKGRHCPVTGGMLDVDANFGTYTDTPVENVTWADLKRIPQGFMAIHVDNYTRRSSGVGFVVEIEIMGKLMQFKYDNVLPTGKMITVAVLESDGKGTITLVPNKSLPCTEVSNTVWGIESETFHKVNMVMKSPNHWDGEKTGNEHLFFIMDTCVNPDTARGFYNEFLRDELSADRKVFEMLGGKLRAPTSDKQLSGLGFSSTQPAKVLVKVQGKINRLIELQF